MKASVDTKAEAQKSKGMAISEKNEKLMEKNPAFKKMMEASIVCQFVLRK